MIRKLQSESQAKIQVDHSGAGMDANHRQVTITGTNESVVKAEEMILFLCANPAVDSMQALQMLIRDKSQSGGLWGSGPPYPNFPNQGQGMPVDDSMVSGTDGNGGFEHTHMSNTSQQICGNRYGPSGGGVNAVVIESDLFPCAKMYMGRVIGQKGVTINDLQKRSGCDIQINQNVPAGQDCQISIKGSRQGIEMAKQMLQDIIELGPNHPYAGGREYQSDFFLFYSVSFIIFYVQHDATLVTLYRWTIWPCPPWWPARLPTAVLPCKPTLSAWVFPSILWNASIWWSTCLSTAHLSTPGPTVRCSTRCFYSCRCISLESSHRC